jgi:hypothetical protein
MQCPAVLATMKSFSRRECALWFLVPSIGLSALMPIIVICTNLSVVMTSSGVGGVADLFWREFVDFGLAAGLWSLGFYLLTFWTGSFWRPVLITAGICFVLFGNVTASVACYHKSDREILREFTQAELAQQNREYQEALLALGSFFALIGGGGALAFQVIRTSKNKFGASTTQILGCGNSHD